MPKIIKGENLTDEQRKLALAAFIYRWTHENSMRTNVYRCDKCDIRKPYVNSVSACGHTHPTIPMVSDHEWIKSHAFEFRNDGSRLIEDSVALPVCLGE